MFQMYILRRLRRWACMDAGSHFYWGASERWKGEGGVFPCLTQLKRAALVDWTFLNLLFQLGEALVSLHLPCTVMSSKTHTRGHTHTPVCYESMFRTKTKQLYYWPNSSLFFPSFFSRVWHRTDFSVVCVGKFSRCTVSFTKRAANSVTW